MPDWTLLGSALLLGLSGSGHCLGMCGGIASALSLGGGGGTAVTVSYHLGRIASYTALGAALGLAAGAVDIAPWTIALRYLAGVLLVAMGLYMADWWRGMMALERIGARLWRPVQQLTARWLPIRRSPQAFAVGLTWGLMPCGLIYSALAWSATAQSAVQSATLMLLFGLGTLPAMLGASLGAGQLRRYLATRGFRTAVALCLIAAGLWSLYTTVTHSAHLLQSDNTPGHHQGMHH